MKYLKKLFKNFKIIDIHQEINYYERQNYTTKSYHYHILIQKNNTNTSVGVIN